MVSLTAAEFAQQRVLCLAVEKLFINLGEAATRAHEILFNTITDDLPALEASLQVVLQALNGV